jgi:hypothetical protein
MSRGSYRSIYTVLIDGPDYQALPPNAKLLLFTLKLNLGPTGIDVLYSAVLEPQTGLTPEQVALSLDVLEHAGWIERERNLVWVVGGLENEPSRSLSNPNHRKEILDHLRSLPRLSIVDRFRRRYDLHEAKNSGRKPDGILDGMGDGIPNHGNGNGRQKGIRKTENYSSDDRKKPRSSRTQKRERVEPPLFAQFWSRYPKRAGGNPRRRALQAYTARLTEGVLADDIIRGLDRYIAYVAAAGKAGTEFVMQAATFVGPDRRWEEAWDEPTTPTADDRVQEMLAEEEAALKRTADLIARRRGEQPGERA